MPDERASALSQSSEDGRALLQARVALFWKVMFFVSLISTVLGAAGTLAKPGIDLFMTMGETAEAAAIWWLCGRSQCRRSARFCRWMETGGLLLNVTGGAFMSRYILASFIRDHALVTAEGTMMADGYVTMLIVGGMSLMLAIRAALIPSSPRYTVLVTALVGTPLVLSTMLVPTASGGVALRPFDSPAYPWLPLTPAMMLGFVILTCAVISWVIYGLRAEVRKARQLGQYVLEEKIGEGGMGEVYRAHHGMMRRPTALKLLRPDKTGEISLRRFEREVQLTARLTHPNTITIFDYGRTDDGVFYYAMELLDGANLQRIVAACGAQPAGRVVRLLAMACGALSEAHSIGLIHRDIKPANIMLCTQGGERDVVKLLDFGLVKELEMDGDVQATAADTLVGTPQYMAPESIVSPSSADARTDIYALGAVAYYLLTGADVFDGKSIVEVCIQHLHHVPEPFSAHRVTVTAELEALVLACLEKDPARRPQSAAELRGRLEACGEQRWDSDDARTWWVEHRAQLELEVVAEVAPRTLVIDGALRTSAAGAFP